jgi:hypothetical protein
MNHPVRKSIYPVGEHPLVAKIDADNYALRTKLHKCLKPVDWNSLSVVRIGTTTLRPVVVFIGVKPDTLAARDGFEVAIACHRVLVDGGCPDVHCEIFEGQVANYATPVEPFDRCLSAQQKCHKSFLPLTSTVGQSIAAQGSTKEGSLGVYLELVERPGQPPMKMALVSAHAVLETEL